MGVLLVAELPGAGALRAGIVTKVADSFRAGIFLYCCMILWFCDILAPQPVRKALKGQVTWVED